MLRSFLSYPVFIGPGAIGEIQSPTCVVGSHGCPRNMLDFECKVKSALRSSLLTLQLLMLCGVYVRLAICELHYVDHRKGRKR